MAWIQTSDENTLPYWINDETGETTRTDPAIAAAATAKQPTTLDEALAAGWFGGYSPRTGIGPGREVMETARQVFRQYGKTDAQLLAAAKQGFETHKQLYGSGYTNSSSIEGILNDLIFPAAGIPAQPQLASRPGWSDADAEARHQTDRAKQEAKSSGNDFLQVGGMALAADLGGPLIGDTLSGLTGLSAAGGLGGVGGSGLTAAEMAALEASAAGEIATGAVGGIGTGGAGVAAGTGGINMTGFMNPAANSPFPGGSTDAIFGANTYTPGLGITEQANMALGLPPGGAPLTGVSALDYPGQVVNLAGGGMTAPQTLSQWLGSGGVQQALGLGTGGSGPLSVGSGGGSASTGSSGVVGAAGGALGNLGSTAPLIGAALGAGAGALGGSNGPAGTITTESGIPDWLRPYITPVLDKYSTGVQNYNADPYGIMPAASREYVDTVSGKYLNPSSNPFLTEYFNKGAEQVKGALSPSFGHMQAFGSNTGYNEALSRGLGDLATGLYGGAYNQERTRQNQLVGMAPNFLQGGTQSTFAPFSTYLNTVGSLGKKEDKPYFEPSTLQTMLGGALAGAGIGNFFK